MAESYPIPTHQGFRDLTGQRFGRLLAVSYAGPARGHQLWNCVCDCGNTCVVRSNNLLTRSSIGCGCIRREKCRERSTTHGRSRTTEFNTWQSIQMRCHNPNDTSYHNYGGRGITVCARWRESFANFLADMGPRPSPKHSLDRINNDGPYSPENCRWATKSEQDANKRSAVLLTYMGSTKIPGEWARLTGIKISTLSARLKLGWTVEDALTMPTRGSKRIDVFPPFTFIA
jgi:hypothetical protein